jgi:UDP-N-acetyl-D-mannosaminuronic acid dehydrogenase
LLIFISYLLNNLCVITYLLVIFVYIRTLSNNNILVIGLGQIGYHNAEYFTSIGCEVDGYDISEQACQRALNNGIVRKISHNFAGYDYYVICVSTHSYNNLFVPYLDGLFEIANKLSREGKTNALVSVDSTITTGTSRKIYKILDHRLHVCHVPHRFFVNEKSVHGIKQVRVLGGCEPCCVERARNFYRDLLGIPVHEVSSIEIAELTKVVENSYRFVEIAFAEELKITCDRSGINFDELRNAVNTKWNIKIMEARDGIGGHCLPKDSQMYLDISATALRSSIVEAAKKVDEQYRSSIPQETQYAYQPSPGSKKNVVME